MSSDENIQGERREEKERRKGSQIQTNGWVREREALLCRHFDHPAAA